VDWLRGELGKAQEVAARCLAEAIPAEALWVFLALTLAFLAIGAMRLYAQRGEKAAFFWDR
jgi:hypothetical protein